MSISPRTGYRAVRGFRGLAGYLAGLAMMAVFHLASADGQIPIGFKADRYVRLWERSPFLLAAPVAPQVTPGAFDKLVLVSWLKDNGKYVIFVQNTETNDTQKITHEPNKDNIRIVEMRPNDNPRLVEAVISNGSEQGAVEFRFETPAGLQQQNNARLTRHPRQVEHALEVQDSILSDFGFRIRPG
jgi:hypothetical protein